MQRNKQGQVTKPSLERKSLKRPDSSWRLTPISLEVVRETLMEGHEHVTSQLEQLEGWLVPREKLGNRLHGSADLKEVRQTLTVARSDAQTASSLIRTKAFDAAFTFMLRSQRAIARGAALALGVQFSAERARAVAGGLGLAKKTQRYRVEVEDAIRDGRLCHYPSTASFARDMLEKQSDSPEAALERVTDPRTIENWTRSFLRQNPQYVVCRAKSAS